jgi:hypothetical protein
MKILSSTKMKMLIGRVYALVAQLDVYHGIVIAEKDRRDDQ